MKIFKRAGTAVLCMMLAFSITWGGYPLAARAEEEQPAPGAKTETGAGAETGGQEGAEQKALAIINLSVGDGQDTPVFKAGEETSLTLNVMNKGNTAAQNVQVTPVVENVDEWPFDVEKLNYDRSLQTIEPGNQAAAVWGDTESGLLTVRDDVSGKSYKLTFRITYDDGEKVYETSKYVFVKTEAKAQEDQNKDDKPQEETPSDKTEPSGEGTSQGGSDGGGEILDAGGVYNSDPVPSGGGSGSTSDGSVPRVIVTGFDTKPGEVKAGTDFTLVIHLKNTSKKTAVSNMLFDIQAPAAGTDAAAEAPAFLPSSGSSTIYLEKIAAGGTKDISIELNARADLVQKPYSVTMNMKYEDGNAAQFEGTSSLAIPVMQEARFEFSEIQVSPDPVSVGDEANITCSLYNLGRVKMYNVKAKFEGEAISGEELFLGNLESGATGSIDSIVTAMAEAYEEENCKIILSYEDDAGKVTTVEQPFTLAVNPMPEMTDMGMIDMPEEESGSPLIVAAAAALIVIAAIIVAIILIRRKKKRKLAAEEEELMDEMERFTEDERE